ncbi:hypothetical protein F5887DRAFT_1092560 [Amanita rubescens]|nr:hypothetical protein F5887DRAFT_1092560 [Amanita rubescens]
MAVVWAILFSRVAPNLSYKKPNSKPKDASELAITKFVRDMPWILPISKHRKGIKSPKPFVTMMSTTIIALRDANSPLYRQAGTRNGFGKEWSEKHSIKEITPVNMVRMGLAKAKSLKMITRACWKTNWEMCSDAEVKPLYNRVMEHLLKRHPYGEFLAVQEIFGRDVAMELEKKGEVIMPHNYQRQSVMVMSQGGKRKGGAVNRSLQGCARVAQKA